MTDEELKTLFGQLVAQLDDLRRHFDVMKEDIDRKLRLLAEQGADVDAGLTGEINNVEARIDRGFAETQAIIKLAVHTQSHRA